MEYVNSEKRDKAQYQFQKDLKEMSLKTEKEKVIHEWINKIIDNILKKMQEDNKK